MALSPVPVSQVERDAALAAFVPLVNVSRSGVTESVHAGAVAAVTADDELVAAAGPADQPVFWRSAAKLHQAMALILAGGLKRWSFDDAQLALMCSSHNGEPVHVRGVASILEQVGIDVGALHCGVHMPHSESATAELQRAGAKPSPLHHMCSGNHAGLLALTRLLGAELETYEAAPAPAQQSALAIAARFAGLAPHRVFLGIDGCGIPAYRTSLRRLALAFARLMAVPRDWEMPIHAAAARIVNAVMRHPDLISGAGEIDAECMKAFRGAAICKLGAEGVCAAAFAPNERFPRGLGIALKIGDGTGSRAIPVVLAACLAQLRVGTEAQRAALERTISRAVKTHRGEVVGEMSPAFKLAVEESSS